MKKKLYWLEYMLGKFGILKKIKAKSRNIILWFNLKFGIDEENTYNIWVLTHVAFDCYNSINFWNFSKFWNEVDIKLIRLHFLNLYCTEPKVDTLKVTIKFDQGLSTF